MKRREFSLTVPAAATALALSGCTTADPIPDPIKPDDCTPPAPLPAVPPVHREYVERRIWEAVVEGVDSLGKDTEFKYPEVYYQDFYKGYKTGDWYRAFLRNLAADLTCGKTPPSDYEDHYKTNYYECARIAGKKAAKLACGTQMNQITLNHFQESLDDTHSFLKRRIAKLNRKGNSDGCPSPEAHLCG